MSRRRDTRARKPRACSCCATAAPCSHRSRSASPARSTSRCVSGSKAGDQVITGPFANVRTLADGEQVRLVGAEQQDHDVNRADVRAMQQILDSARIALQSIWANKLRSLLTVLGNIVAVTSIVTVVSLIQGMNAYVSNAIVSDVGADSFTIQRMPPIRTRGRRGTHSRQPAHHAGGSATRSSASATTSRR